MIGKIYLVKTSEDKVVPALCISIQKSGNLLAAQIRTANKQDAMAAQMKEEPTRKKQKNKTPVKKPNTIYIGKPNGLRDPSAVMVLKVHQVEPNNVIKELAHLSDDMVQSVIQLRKQLLTHQRLHEEMHIVKRKIELAKFNNENYTPLEIRLDHILKELGYGYGGRNKREKGYLNYREVPTNGIVKIYLGGR
ncbi:hypothetical protein M1K46_03420 [Fictibacillus sp. WQ 8-8]|uniref:hypothetical protein n=1 Tax=Fictibacillus sp. WQ 8-8 TaxID=2938788 RepID=UPI00210963F0|nr:hypothetical protein [Fictibacillus sp. WQ 8-8]MCQ6264715.1 hypothetical protein [Fictibacillus sp. WQ 8-8]